MQKLNLLLSDRIEGVLEKALTKNESFLFLNKDFIVDKVLINSKEINVEQIEIINNVKKYKLKSQKGDLITICYHGILNGQSGAYPYVREKTTDDFYILREETRYFPTFLLPDSVEYINNMINPKAEDEFEVSIKLNRKGNFSSNLVQNDKIYRGFNPTIAVGYFETKAFNFG